MVAINFKRQFADAVREGRKRQTIRRDRKRNPIVTGTKLQLYVAQRSSNAEKLLETVCTKTEAISINGDGSWVMVGGRDLTFEQKQELAHADGFKDWGACLEFIRYAYGLPFDGRVIHW